MQGEVYYRRRWAGLLGVGLWLMVSLSACGVLSRSKEQAGVPSPALHQESMADSVALGEMRGAASAPPAGVNSGSAESLPPLTESRKIITTGSMTVEVEDIDQALAELKELVTRHGGFIAQREISVEDNWRQGRVTVRVPASHFEALYEGAQGLGTVKRDEQQGDDVTEEWQDLEARVRIRRHEEQSLVALMKQQGRLGELLQVERRLWEVREQIEQAEGRLRYLRDRVELATLTLYLNQQQPAGMASGSRWNLRYHLWQAVVSLNHLVKGLVISLTYIVITGLPIWLLILLVIWWVRRRLRASRQRRQQTEVDLPGLAEAATAAQRPPAAQMETKAQGQAGAGSDMEGPPPAGEG